MANPRLPDMMMGSLPSSGSFPVPGQPNPVSGPAAAPNSSWTSSNSIINSLIPGQSGLTQSASNIIDQLLSGQPATSRARSENAYFGAGSGMPGSEFVRGRGFDLYNKQGDANKQQGIQDLLAMISGYSGPALTERGQNTQASQFNQSLAQQQAEFAAKLKAQQDQFNQQMNLELQKFGFDKNRYSQQQPKNYGYGTIGYQPGTPSGQPLGNFQYNPGYAGPRDW